MCNQLCDVPMKVRWQEMELELMSLEQLYVRCVNNNKRLPNTRADLNGWLGMMKVVLRKECYDHLATLMDDSAKVDFANLCLEESLSPFGARMAAYSVPKAQRGRSCYWPDCPTA